MTLKRDEYRENARRTVRLFEARYASVAVDFPPLVLARRWLVAMERTELDIAEVADIAREAGREKNRHDVAFFTFSNDVQRIHHELWESRLAEGEAPN